MGFLACDIGGTKTEVGYFESLESPHFLIEKRYQSKNYLDFQDIINAFIEEYEVKITGIGIGIAGPVINQVGRATNLPWVVDASQIKKNFNLSVCTVVNDLVANAYGLKELPNSAFETIHPGEKNLIGNQCLISAGTGLGEAGLYFDGKVSHAFPTEGGHCDFAPTSDEEIELLKYLKKLYTHVSYERILSGNGFNLLYDFVTKIQKLPVEKSVEAVLDLDERAKTITKLACDHKSETCIQVVDRFISIYAKEAANLALKHYALGGLFVGGGIAPKILPFFKKPLFLESFQDKGRLSKWLKQVQVKIILLESCALLGAALSIRKIKN
jgi:glucokinase